MKALAAGKVPPLLLIYGGAGSGKTHLIEALIIALGKRGIYVPYLTVAEFMDRLKASIQPEPGYPGLETTTMNYAKMPGLVLDDWGIEYGTNWEASRLEMVIDYRYRASLLTVVTANRDYVELNRLHPRIISRFSEPGVGQIILNEAEDYRRRRV